jgi:hypothetical protein
MLRVIIGGQVAIETAYKLVGNKLTMTIDGQAVEYKRKPVMGPG